LRWEFAPTAVGGYTICIPELMKSDVMTKRVLIFTSASVVALACIFGVIISTVLEASNAGSARKFLPPFHAIPGVSVTLVLARSAGSLVTRGFLFTGPQMRGPADGLRLFEPQLRADGWELVASCDSPNMASSSWRKNTPFKQELSFTVLATERGNYVGSITAVPF
jgi:hypothetical protein